MDFGKRLKDEREHQGFTLDDVEQETKIRKLYIKAIEEENFSILPPRVYAIGFVKRYAKFLNLNETEIAAEFKMLAYTENETQEEEEPEHTPLMSAGEKIGKSRFNVKKIAAAIAFLIIAIWLGNILVGYLADRTQKTERTKPPVVEQQPVRQTPKPSPVVNDQAKVKITASQSCWTQIKVDDVVKFEGTMRPGEEQEFTGQDKVYIKAGNAGGLSVMLNDKNIQNFGQIGEVVEYDLLKDGTAKKL